MASVQFDNSMQRLVFTIANASTGAILYNGDAGSLDVERTFSKTSITLNDVKAVMHTPTKEQDKTLHDYSEEYGAVWAQVFRTVMQILKDLEEAK